MPTTLFDRITLFAVLTMLAIVFLNYGGLPDSIPTHFNGKGEADAFGSKSSIWLLPIIGTVLCGGMYWLTIFIPTQKIKPKPGQSMVAAEKQQVIALEMLRVLNVIIAVSFAYIVYATIQTAHGKWQGLGSSFTILFLVVIFGGTGYYIYKMIKVPNNE